MIRVVVAVVAVATARAAAQPIPGTTDDPIRELALAPGIVDSPLVPGLAIRGGAVADTVVLFDGFELPWLDHGLGLRSIVPRGAVGPIGYLPSDFGVEYGRGTSVIALTTQQPHRRWGLVPGNSLEPGLDVLDGGFLQVSEPGGFPGLPRASITAAARWSVLGPLFPELSDRDVSLATPPSYSDVVLRFEHPVSSTWTATVSGIVTEDQLAPASSRYASRLVLATRYRGTAWAATAAASTMVVERASELVGEQHLFVSQTTIDSRAEALYTASHAAGLSDLTWRLGEQTNFARYDLDVAWPLLPREGWPDPQSYDPLDTTMRADRVQWLFDAAVWTAIAANLSPRVRTTIGVRVDRFGDYLTTQPRGSLDIALSRATVVRFAAGAYRRPPERLDEILAGNLHPERSTQLIASVAHELRDTVALTGAVYYIDHTRLISRDLEGVLANTGLGTALGAELTATLRTGPWFAYLAGTLASSVRRAHARDYERPVQYEQPYGVDGVLRWQRDAWSLGARLRVAAGVPYTPVAGAVYVSDSDYFAPLFERTYSGRAPIQHRVDLRVDRTFALGKQAQLSVFLDLHDAEASTSALGYTYSYDYRQRISIRAIPLFPMLGVRGSL